MKIREIAETITADFSDECPVFNRDKRYANPQDVLMRCSSFVSESEGKYSQHILALRHLNGNYRHNQAVPFLGQRVSCIDSC